jgi:hypothetical protein
MQHRGVESEVFCRIVDDMKDCYRVDLTCDDDLVPLYQRFKLFCCHAVALRIR